MNTARLLARLGSPLPLGWLIRLSGERAFRPMYHTVQGDYPLPHIEHLYAPHTAARFERDLDLLLRHFEPVGLERLPEVLAGERRARPALFLTFDDGLREVHDVALPILRAKGVPATVFVNSAFVGNRALFFRYLASALVAHGERRPPSAATARALIERTCPDAAAAEAAGSPAERWPRALLGVPYARRDALERAAELLEFDVAGFLAEQRPYLDVAELSRLRDEGFSIGAHSIDHPLYRELELDEQLRQTRVSCDYVRTTFAQPDCSFAFPFSDVGVPRRFFERVHEEAMASRVFGGQGYRDERLPNVVQRHSIEGRAGSMGDMLRVDHLLSLARRLLGRYRVARA